VIWLLGDVHSHFVHVEQAIDAAAITPVAVVFLGDIEAPIPFEDCIEGILKRGVEVYWIRGNHDTDSKENWANLQDSIGRNIDGKVITVDGLRVAGLGGIFRGEIWHPEIDGGKPTHSNYQEFEKFIRSNANLKRRLTKRDLVQLQAVPPESRQWNSAVLDQSRAGKLLKHHSTIFPADYERLADQKADILVAHEAPSFHPHGFREIDLLAQMMGATVFHGHHHDSLEYSRQFDALGFRAYGVGFCGISSYDPVTGLVATVAPGDFDEHRRYREQHGITKRLITDARAGDSPADVEQRQSYLDALTITGRRKP
jgi:predicted phosphodiesterase